MSVQRIRNKTKLNKIDFCRRFGVKYAVYRHWESGMTIPDVHVETMLEMVVDLSLKHPEVLDGVDWTKPVDIRKVREQCGLTRTEICDKFAILQSTLQSWEVGRRSPPTYVQQWFRILCENTKFRKKGKR